MKIPLLSTIALTALTLARLIATPASAVEAFSWTNLDSDLAGVAPVTDSDLVNPRGLAPLPDGGIWVANTASGTLTKYDLLGRPLPLAAPGLVSVPAPAGSANSSAAVSGLVLNYVAFDPTATNDFLVGPSGSQKAAVLLMTSEDGTIAGYNHEVNATAAFTMVTTPGAAYKGLALSFDGQGNHRLYAANFAAGSIDIFDSGFNPVVSPGFVDPHVNSGYAPANIRHFAVPNKATKKVDHYLIVAYAKQDAQKQQPVPGAGNGYILVFKTDGTLQATLVDLGGAAPNALNSPWGMAIAHLPFGKYGEVLLVGNAGDGTIHRYSLANFAGTPLGTLLRHDGAPLQIDHLHALHFAEKHRTDKLAAAAKDELDEDDTALYFTAGIASETHGLFGRIVAH